MSAPDRQLGPLKRRDGEPLFDEPWQAQALAMADSLIRQGAFSAEAWAETLGAAIREAESAGAPDDAQSYYCVVLSALETLLDRGGTAGREEVEARRQEWERAYRNTPHGQPVLLSAGHETTDR